MAIIVMNQTKDFVKKVRTPRPNNKYIYYYAIKGDFGYGWEKVCNYSYEEYDYALNDLKEYKKSGYGIYKLVSCRELKKGVE